MKTQEIDSLLRFDTIRLIKILEMIQATFIGLMVSSLFSEIINKYLMIEFKERYYFKDGSYFVGNKSPLLYIHLFLDIVVIVIVTYYLKKIAVIIPTPFALLDKNYISGLKNESAVAFTIGMNFVFRKKLVNFSKRLDVLLGSSELYVQNIVEENK
tara:strand:- start:10 stop:477 length:468 start_codon:yes stop_codon:yes gene_type:complete